MKPYFLSLINTVLHFLDFASQNLIVPRLTIKIIKIVTNSFLWDLAFPPFLPPPLIEMFPLRHCQGGGGGGKEIPSNIPHSPFIWSYIRSNKGELKGILLWGVGMLKVLSSEMDLAEIEIWEKSASLRHWLQVPNLFMAPLPKDVCRENKAAGRVVCAFGNLFPNSQSKTRRRSKLLKSCHRMWDGRIFLKTSARHSLMTTYRMNLILARSISVDSTFTRWSDYNPCRRSLSPLGLPYLEDLKEKMGLF